MTKKIEMTNSAEVENSANSEMCKYIVNLEKKETMKLELIYSFAVTDEKGDTIDSIVNPIRKTYNNVSIPYFLSDIETYENAWGAMGAEIETKEYLDGMAVFMKLAIILPNGGMYDQFITFICTNENENEA